MVGKNLEKIKMRISRAAQKAHRDADSILLVAVSKTHPVDVIRQAVAAGQTVFGENRVQEARAKVDAFDDSVRWHLVGHLQKNKAKYAVRMFDLIHSVDSAELALELSRRALQINKVQDILIQVNVSGETTKFGISPGELPELVREVVTYEGVRLQGLMTMPPFFEMPERARPYFRKLKEISLNLADWGWPGSNPVELSMGMSGDFEVAIEEGATIVRVGTAIFGAR